MGDRVSFPKVQEIDEYTAQYGFGTLVWVANRDGFEVLRM